MARLWGQNYLPGNREIITYHDDLVIDKVFCPLSWILTCISAYVYHACGDVSYWPI